MNVPHKYTVEELDNLLTDEELKSIGKQDLIVLYQHLRNDYVKLYNKYEDATFS